MERIRGMSNEINPWEHPDLKQIWKTKSSFMSYIRSCLRKAWNRHPAKLMAIRRDRKRIPNPNPKGKVKDVWGFDCPICGGTFVQKEGQVDHINPAGSLRDKKDIQSFTERLVWITPDDLRTICKTCNSTFSLAERQGISFELAYATKKAIQIEKEKRVNEVLEGLGIKPESNATKRRKQLVDAFMKEERLNE